MEKNNIMNAAERESFRSLACWGRTGKDEKLRVFLQDMARSLTQRFTSVMSEEAEEINLNCFSKRFVNEAKGDVGDNTLFIN